MAWTAKRPVAHAILHLDQSAYKQLINDNASQGLRVEGLPLQVSGKCQEALIQHSQITADQWSMPLNATQYPIICNVYPWFSQGCALIIVIIRANIYFCHLQGTDLRTVDQKTPTLGCILRLITSEVYFPLVAFHNIHWQVFPNIKFPHSYKSKSPHFLGVLLSSESREDLTYFPTYHYVHIRLTA